MSARPRIVLLHDHADPQGVASALSEIGLWTTKVSHRARAAFVILPPSPPVERERLLAIEGVLEVLSSASEHPLLDAHPAVVVAAGRRIGRDASPVLMAGPCSVESRQQVLDTAAVVASSGGSFLRGSAFKPRTSPYSFQGSGAAGLGWLKDAADAYGLGVVTEAVSEPDVEPVAEVADLLQVGSRTMHSPGLLRRVAAAGKPVLLKRGMAATLVEWLLAAETCLLHGAPAVLLCERGVRSFDGSARNLLDVAAVALMRMEYGLPVIADPSHAAGRRDLVVPLAKAALAAGAAGLLVEVHLAPGRARSDGPQALSPEDLRELMPGHRALGGEASRGAAAGGGEVRAESENQARVDPVSRRVGNG